MDIVLLCPSSHTWFQAFFVINPSVLQQYLHHALIQHLASLLVCAVLYVITFTPSFILSPECAHLSPNTCKPFFMFCTVFSAQCCPSSNCISHAIIRCRMTILIWYFPWLTAQFFPREDCPIRPSPLFAYLRIWNSLMCQNVGCRSIRCAFSLTKKVAVPAAILFRSILMSAARISTSGAPTNIAFPPALIYLLTAFNNDWLSRKYSHGSSISVLRSARQSIFLE